MKKSKELLLTALSVVILFSIFSFYGCNSNEEETNICADVQCQNGGEKSLNFAGDACECDCPEGYTGEFCELTTTSCTGVECPDGGNPNPANDCACE